MQKHIFLSKKCNNIVHKDKFVEFVWSENNKYYIGNNYINISLSEIFTIPRVRPTPSTLSSHCGKPIYPAFNVTAHQHRIAFTGVHGDSCNPIFISGDYPEKLASEWLHFDNILDIMGLSLFQTSSSLELQQYPNHSQSPSLMKWKYFILRHSLALICHQESFWLLSATLLISPSPPPH